MISDQILEPGAKDRLSRLALVKKEKVRSPIHALAIASLCHIVIFVLLFSNILLFSTILLLSVYFNHRITTTLTPLGTRCRGFPAQCCTNWEITSEGNFDFVTQHVRVC